MKKILAGIIATLFLVSCGGGNSDLINPDAEVVYFYGATCPHCQELNQKLEEAGGIEQYSVEKREVYYNAENNKLFLETAKELGLKEDAVGVPFAYNKTTKKYAIGTTPAFDIITGNTSQETQTSSGELSE